MTDRNLITYGSGKEAHEIKFEGTPHFANHDHSNIIDLPTLPRPTLADFIKHIGLFGSAGVFDIAQAYLHKSELSQLAVAIQDAEPKKLRRIRLTGQTKLTRRQKRQAIEQLIKDDIPTSRIAKHLKVSESTVARVRAEIRDRTPQEAGQTLDVDDQGGPEHVNSEQDTNLP